MTSPAPLPSSQEDADAIVVIVRGVEPRLQESVIRNALATSCVSRAKRRRLARALESDPGLLTCGRAEGPVAVDQLIHALIAAGARRLVAPQCPICGNQEAMLTERLDGKRICQTCKTSFRANTRPCSSCGSALNVNCRDRQGRPVCRSCRPGDGEDPVGRLVDQVQPLAPGLTAEQLQTAIGASNKQSYALLKVSWEIEDRPALLTGEGAHGTPHLMRLLVELQKIGASGIVVPDCPSCSHTRPLLFRAKNGIRICRRCYDSEQRTEPCTTCGKTRTVVSRTEGGAARCGSCTARDPKNFEECVRCHNVRAVGRRTSGGTLCKACYRLPVDLCSLCGRRRPCLGASTPTPRCESCYQQKHQCHHCGKTHRPRARIPEGYLCQTCFRKSPVALRTCSNCEEVTVLWHRGLCSRCAVHRRVEELLHGPDDTIRPGLETVFDTLTTVDDPKAVLTWLTPRRKATAILAQLGTDGFPVEHTTLDQHGRSPAVDHLRNVLVMAGALPRRDEQMTGLTRSLEEICSSVEHADDRKLLQAFTQWDQLSRLRHRLAGQMATYNQVDTVRVQVKEAARLITWLRALGTDLSNCTQHEIDLWLSDGRSVHVHARAFVKWAVKHHHASGLEIPPPARMNPTPPLDNEKRIEIANRLMGDTTIALDLRVAGLLIVLFAQAAANIVQIRSHQVIRTDTGVHLALGREPVCLPGELGILVGRLAESRRPSAHIGRGNPSPWLFPGRFPAQHRNSASLLDRLKDLGIYARPNQHSAMRELSSDLPEAVINRLLGISITSVDRWRAGGQYGAYAANVARR